MSSNIARLATKIETPTRFFNVESPTYSEGEGPYRLFPFTFSNGVLDISYDGNNFKSQMVDNSGISPYSEPNTVIEIMGGANYLVTSLGSKFKDYIRAWRYDTIDGGSPIELLSKKTLLVPVRECDYPNMGRGTVYRITQTAPSGDDYLIGNEANKFYKTFILKTPLTFTTVEDGVKQYITFRSMLDIED